MPPIPPPARAQAAGRLRRLGRGQTVQFVGTADVTEQLLAAAGPVGKRGAAAGSSSGRQRVTSRALLQWVMGNTMAATQHGLLQWTGQGLRFAVARGEPALAVEDERLGLDELYGLARALQPVPDLAAAHRDELLRRLQQLGGAGGGRAGGAAALLQLLPPQERGWAERIGECAAEHGRGHTAMAGAAEVGEECERELEKEEEVEEEVQREMPRAAPAVEEDWAYERTLGARSAAELPVKLYNLRKAVNSLWPPGLRDIRWSGEARCTLNFMSTTGTVKAGGNLNELLRPVDALLLFPSREVLLLSEREADGVLGAAWAARRGGGGSRVSGKESGKGPILLHLAYARAALRGGAPGGGTPVPLAVSLAAGGAARPVPRDAVAGGLHAHELASVQLFNGEVGTCSMGELRALVAGKRALAEALVGMRGRSLAFARSDLGLACD
jgi:hypothetical protein